MATNFMENRVLLTIRDARRHLMRPGRRQVDSRWCGMWAWTLMLTLLILRIKPTNMVAAPPLTAEELIQLAGLGKYEQALERREIISVVRPEQEGDNELVVLMDR